jgi:hypothetical protein
MRHTGRYGHELKVRRELEGRKLCMGSTEVVQYKRTRPEYATQYSPNILLLIASMPWNGSQASQ